MELVDISVHDSTTIHKTLGMRGYDRTPQWKPLISKKTTITGCLKFAKEHLITPQHYWENVLWTDKTDAELFGKNIRRNVWRKRTLHSNIKTFPMVKWRGPHDFELLCCL